MTTAGFRCTHPGRFRGHRARMRADAGRSGRGHRAPELRDKALASARTLLGRLEAVPARADRLGRGCAARGRDQRETVRMTPDISFVARRAAVGDRRERASTRLDHVVVRQPAQQVEQAEDRRVRDPAEQVQRPLELARIELRHQADRAIEQADEDEERRQPVAERRPAPGRPGSPPRPRRLRAPSPRAPRRSGRLRGPCARR